MGMTGRNGIPAHRGSSSYKLLALAQLIPLFHPAEKPPPGIHATAMVDELFASCVERGEGGSDHSALVRAIERLAGHAIAG